MSAGRATVMAATLLAAAGCGTPATSGVGASCVGPQATLAPDRVTVGQPVTYTVEWLTIGCRDTNPSDERVEPLRGIPVELVQGSGHAAVGTVSGTGDHFSGSLSFAVPAWLRPGAAEVVLRAPVPDRLPFTVVPVP